MRMIAHSYDSYDHAVRAVQALESAGVPHDDISLVSGDKSRDVASVPGDTAEAAGTGAGTGASIGTVLGGGAGLLAGLGMLAIPGVGPVVAAGWLVATVAGAGVGAAAGGLLGSLTGAGIEEADAKAYTDHVERGGTLVTVRASDDMAADVEYMLEHGSARTSMTASTATDAGKVDLVDRRPINRPLTGVGADGFRERTTGTTTGVTGGPESLRDNAATRAVDRTLDTNLSGENPSRRI